MIFEGIQIDIYYQKPPLHYMNRVFDQVCCKSLGLSLTDRTCIATGFRLKTKIVTAERVWKGLSLFDYVKKLPVDYLKIDGVFVKDIIEDPVDLALVRSTNEIGHVKDKKTIEELDELKKIGVDFAQGYHLDRPKPLSEITNLDK